MIRIRAYAKVNLFLEILGKRADGYHTLSTLFQSISLADELSLSRSDKIELTCSDPSLPTDDGNLVVRAAKRLQALLRERQGARITLKKNIPLGAGLGGGSSDAAAILSALPRFWRRKLPKNVLVQCARQLGADVPFFLKGGTCAAGGIGDRLTPLPPLPKIWLVLVYPGFGVSTKEAYATVRLPPLKKGNGGGRRGDPPNLPFTKGGDNQWVKYLFNRFEEFVFPNHPALAELKKDLKRAGALGSLMSGSGSTVFGIVESPVQGREILTKMKKRYPQSWLVHTV